MESGFIGHLKHCCCKSILVRVLLPVYLSKDCWIQPQTFSVSAPAAPRGCETQWASPWYVLGWKTPDIWVSTISVFLLPASFLFSSADLISALQFYPSPAMKQRWKWWGHFMAGRHKGWSRSQKVHFAPELFKMKSLKHLFLLRELEMYEAVKTQLRCSVVSVTVFVEFR